MGSEIAEKEEYFKKLREWVNQTKLLQNATACFPYYLASNYPNYFSLNGLNSGTEGTASRTATATLPRTATPTARTVSTTPRASGQDGGYEYILAPLWKRFAAEIIDVILLLSIKISITFTLLNAFNWDLNFEFDSEFVNKMVTEEDPKYVNITDVVTLSADLVVMEILMKIFVCLYEALCTMTGRVHNGGGTPGKLLLRLRVVHADVVIVPNRDPAVNARGGAMRALLYPATNPGFRRALIRAVAKNLMLALLFPVCFTFLFVKNNRTFYDVLSKTVVIEENSAAVYRRN